MNTFDWRLADWYSWNKLCSANVGRWIWLLKPKWEKWWVHRCLLILTVSLASIYRYHLTGALILLSAPAKIMLISWLSIPARYQVHFHFTGFKSFSQNWQKTPHQTKNQLTHHKMQSLQVWVKPGVQQHRLTPRCNGVVGGEREKMLCPRELQEEQSKEDCLFPNSWNMDYTKHSKMVSNLMVFTSVLHSQTPMRAGVTRVTTAFFLNISGHCLQASSPSTTLYLSFDTKGAHPVRTET